MKTTLRRSEAAALADLVAQVIRDITAAYPHLKGAPLVRWVQRAGLNEPAGITHDLLMGYLKLTSHRSTVEQIERGAPRPKRRPRNRAQIISFPVHARLVLAA